MRKGANFVPSGISRRLPRRVSVVGSVAGFFALALRCRRHTGALQRPGGRTGLTGASHILVFRRHCGRCLSARLFSSAAAGVREPQ